MLDTIFQIKKTKVNQETVQFTIEPLPQGYGHTLGNSLRRVLLTSLPGTAITQIKVSGVKHKFSTLPGLKEDVIELILNVKQIRVKYAGEKPVKLQLEKTGPGPIFAGDIKTPAGVDIVNKDLMLGNLADKKSKLKIEMVAEKGYGYLPTEERKSDKLGVLIIDASFSPIRLVNYRVEATRVGRKTDLDRLILDVTSDGTVKAEDALKVSAKVLIAFLNQIVDPKKLPVSKKKDEGQVSETMKLTVEELELPTRIVNALRRGGYGTVSELLAASNQDLTKVKNLGEKSIKIVQAALAKKGVLAIK
jgi:DNA-directed RNA polymerase subunit alpha